jgi:hypothetical protein
MNLRYTCNTINSAFNFFVVSVIEIEYEVKTTTEDELLLNVKRTHMEVVT